MSRQLYTISPLSIIINCNFLWERKIFQNALRRPMWFQIFWRHSTGSGPQIFTIFPPLPGFSSRKFGSDAPHCSPKLFRIFFRIFRQWFLWVSPSAGLAPHPSEYFFSPLQPSSPPILGKFLPPPFCYHRWFEVQILLKFSLGSDFPQISRRNLEFLKSAQFFSQISPGRPVPKFSAISIVLRFFSEIPLIFQLWVESFYLFGDLGPGLLISSCSGQVVWSCPSIPGSNLFCLLVFIFICFKFSASALQTYWPISGHDAPFQPIVVHDAPRGCVWSLVDSSVIQLFSSLRVGLYFIYILLAKSDSNFCPVVLVHPIFSSSHFLWQLNHTKAIRCKGVTFH